MVIIQKGFKHDESGETLLAKFAVKEDPSWE
jgi:hypothetical protein